jgi:hypothetical protein
MPMEFPGPRWLGVVVIPNPDNRASIDRIPSEMVEFPTQDTFGLTGVIRRIISLKTGRLGLILWPVRTLS